MSATSAAQMRAWRGPALLPYGPALAKPKGEVTL